LIRKENVGTVIKMIGKGAGRNMGNMSRQNKVSAK